MGLVPNFEYMRINTKSLKCSYCLDLPFTKSDVGLLKLAFQLVLRGWVGQASLA